MEISAPHVPRWAWNVPLARRVLLLAAGILAVLCALLAQHPADQQDVPTWVVVVSLLAIVAAFALPDPVWRLPVQGRRETALGIGVCAGLLGLPALIAVAFWSQEPFKSYEVFTRTTSSWAAFIWLAGMIAALVVSWPSGEAVEGDAQPGLLARVRPLLVLEGLALLLVLDVAAGLRLWHLDSLPEGIWWDESDFAASAQRLLSMPFQPLAPGNFGHNPSLYFYAMAVLQQFGGNSIGMTRLTSAIFGVVAVVAVYLLGRRAGGPALGLCAAALLAIGQWAIDFSRFGMSNIAAPAMIALGFVALGMAMDRPRAFWFTLSGLLLGLSLLTYAGGFLAGAGVAIALLAIRTATDAPFRRAAWPTMLLLPLGLVVGAAPFLMAILLNSDYTLAREHTVSLFNEPVCAQWSTCWDALRENLRRHLIMLTISGDNNGRHNLPGAPMLDPATGACLLLGLGICLRHIGRWFHQLLLLWLAASMLGGILSLDFEAPQGARTVGAVAPIALIAALPLALLATWVWRAVPVVIASLRGHRAAEGRAIPLAIAALGGQRAAEGPAASPPWQIGSALAAAVIVACPIGIGAAHDINQYFVQQASNITAWQEMDGQLTIIGRAAAALVRQGYVVRVDPSMAGDPVMEYAAGQLGLGAYDTGMPVSLPVPDPGLALIVPQSVDSVRAYIQQAYPTADAIPLAPRFDSSQVQATAFLIRPSDAARNIGYTAVLGTGQGARTLTHLQGDAPWPAGAGAAAQATLRGTLQIGTQQSWRPLAFRVTGGRTVALTIDGDTWRGASPALCLGAGNHALSAAVTGRAGAALGLQWVTAPACGAQGPFATWQAIPAQNLAAPELPTGGLLGLYYNGPSIGAEPSLARVDRTVNTYYQEPPPGTNFPFSAQWYGTLRIDQGGVYRFRLASTGPSQLAIDGSQVVSSPAGDSVDGSVMLQPGRHSLHLLYFGTGGYLHCYLNWAPPGQDFTPIPPSVTEPAHG